MLILLGSAGYTGSFTAIKSQFGNFTNFSLSRILFPNWEQKVRLLGKDKLQVALDGNAKIWLRSWIAELTSAHWKEATDVLSQFPRATLASPDTFIFQVGEAVWIIELAVYFPQGIALVVSMDRPAS